MSRTECTMSPQELLAYWLGELDAAAELQMDEHILACAECSARLRALVELGAAVRAELLHGAFGFVLPPAFIRRIRDAGLRIREYDLEPGGSVNCTVTPADELVVAHLHAPLQGVRRLDFVLHDPNTGARRVSDVAFDPAADGVTMVPSVPYLRSLRHERQRVQLVAIEGVEERVIGEYTFNHYPS